ncbi:MAG: lytic transglycosylase domain-containing protein [Acidobacteriota bacterium]|jgi:soluble lytic murein transglycosylase-like protein|nr:lytic transglycosylase domain-containing protein [Acidobacteriota bacterium]
MKSNLRKIMLVFAVLVVAGLAGLFLAMDEFNRKYEYQLVSLDSMRQRVQKLEKELEERNRQLQDYDLTRYRVQAFARRYPLFDRIARVVFEKSREYGFHPRLVMGVIQVESAFNPKAVSNRGAYGLMQVNMAVWKDELQIDHKRIFDIEYNIDLGLKILKRYSLVAKGNIQRALHLYNNGYKYNNTKYVKQVNEVLFDSGINQLSRFNLSQ